MVLGEHSDADIGESALRGRRKDPDERNPGVKECGLEETRHSETLDLELRKIEKNENEKAVVCDVLTNECQLLCRVRCCPWDFAYVELCRYDAVLPHILSLLKQRYDKAYTSVRVVDSFHKEDGGSFWLRVCGDDSATPFDREVLSMPWISDTQFELVPVPTS